MEGVCRVSNKELQEMCQGEWLNDNIRTEYDVVYDPGIYIDPMVPIFIFILYYHNIPSCTEERST